MRRILAAVHITRRNVGVLSHPSTPLPLPRCDLYHRAHRTARCPSRVVCISAAAAAAAATSTTRALLVARCHMCQPTMLKWGSASLRRRGLRKRAAVPTAPSSEFAPMHASSDTQHAQSQRESVHVIAHELLESLSPTHTFPDAVDDAQRAEPHAKGDGDVQQQQQQQHQQWQRVQKKYANGAKESPSSRTPLLQQSMHAPVTAGVTAASTHTTSRSDHEESGMEGEGSFCGTRHPGVPPADSTIANTSTAGEVYGTDRGTTVLHGKQATVHGNKEGGRDCAEDRRRRDAEEKSEHRASPPSRSADAAAREASSSTMRSGTEDVCDGGSATGRRVHGGVEEEPVMHTVTTTPRRGRKRSGCRKLCARTSMPRVSDLAGSPAGSDGPAKPHRRRMELYSTEASDSAHITPQCVIAGTTERPVSSVRTRPDSNDAGQSTSSLGHCSDEHELTMDTVQTNERARMNGRPEAQCPQPNSTAPTSRNSIVHRKGTCDANEDMSSVSSSSSSTHRPHVNASIDDPHVGRAGGCVAHTTAPAHSAELVPNDTQGHNRTRSTSIRDCVRHVESSCTNTESNDAQEESLSSPITAQSLHNACMANQTDYQPRHHPRRRRRGGSGNDVNTNPNSNRNDHSNICGACDRNISDDGSRCRANSTRAVVPNSSPIDWMPTERVTVIDESTRSSSQTPLAAQTPSRRRGVRSRGLPTVHDAPSTTTARGASPMAHRTRQDSRDTETMGDVRTAESSRVGSSASVDVAAVAAKVQSGGLHGTASAPPNHAPKSQSTAARIRALVMKGAGMTGTSRRKQQQQQQQQQQEEDKQQQEQDRTLLQPRRQCPQAGQGNHARVDESNAAPRQALKLSTMNPLLCPDYRERVLVIFAELAEINFALGERYKAASYQSAVERLKKNDRIFQLLPPNLLPLPSSLGHVMLHQASSADRLARNSSTNSRDDKHSDTDATVHERNGDAGDVSAMREMLCRRERVISPDGMLPGVSEKLKNKIVEILRTGDLAERHKLQGRPLIRAIQEITQVHGFGPRTATQLYKTHGIRTVQELKQYAHAKDDEDDEDSPAVHGCSSVSADTSPTTGDSASAQDVQKMSSFSGRVAGVTGAKPAARSFRLTDAQRLGLRYHDEINQRLPHSEGKLHEATLQRLLRKHLGKGYMLTVCGSYRRGTSDSGDIDVLLTRSADCVGTGDDNASGAHPTAHHDHSHADVMSMCNGKGCRDVHPSSRNQRAHNAPDDVMRVFIDALKAEGYVEATLAQGATKFMGIARLHEGDDVACTTCLPLSSGNDSSKNKNDNTNTMRPSAQARSFLARRLDVRFVDRASYPAALLYFTGSKNFNVIMRAEAIKKRYVLNEYGLFRNSAGSGCGERDGAAASQEETNKLHEMIAKLAKVQFYFSSHALGESKGGFFAGVNHPTASCGVPTTDNGHITGKDHGVGANGGTDSGVDSDAAECGGAQVKQAKKGRAMSAKELHDLRDIARQVEARRVKVHSEEQIFEAIGMDYVDPADRNM